ncbi:ankyrin, partial [Hortaea werneckii]
PAVSNVQARLNGGDEDAQSEAETLIDSPVKKREAAKANESAHPEKPPRSKIGGLPVFGDEEEEEEDESIATPVQSTETGDAKASSGANVKEQGADGDAMDFTRGNDDGSESLSSARSSQSAESSRESSRERAMSEKAERHHDGGDSPNPRKRKKRASSVEFPSKRRSMDVPSMDVPKRQLRGLYSEDSAIRDERSQSPHLRHRRTHSTQSAFMDGSAENNARKRRAVTQFPVRDPKTGKNGWEESDASSETASHGQVEARRPQRGIGRSTSTPGRPAGGGKRHVNKYGFTKLAEACEQDDLDAVRKWREQDPDQIELAEFAGNKPLQIAALNGNDQVVAYLIDQGCQIDCANVDKDTPLIDAAENGHLDVVKILLDAGVDPLRQNLKGQQALDVVTDDTDDADGIRAALRQAIEKWNSSDAKQRREEEEEQRHRAGPSKELHFMARTYENLLRLVEINDRNGVREFLDARVPVDNVVIAL